MKEPVGLRLAFAFLLVALDLWALNENQGVTHVVFRQEETPDRLRFLRGLSR